MTPLVQFNNECSLASIATLNSLSQADYTALSRLAREAGARYASDYTLRRAIEIGIAVSKALGFYVPEGYPGVASCSLDGAGIKPDFSGKGIVRIMYIRKRCRTFTCHVVTFNEGKFYESNGTVYDSWDHLAALYKKAGDRELRIVKIFR
jgi:hypothetical protein